MVGPRSPQVCSPTRPYLSSALKESTCVPTLSSPRYKCNFYLPQTWFAILSMMSLRIVEHIIWRAAKMNGALKITQLYFYLYIFFRYNVAILLITYIIPIIIISISTAHMSIVLWWRQPATSINTPQLERAKRKKQKVCM